MYTRKTIQELTLKDDFMFGAVMSEEANCKRFLELVLGFPIDRVETNKEKSIIYRPENKGIRLDVYAKDENNTHYNVEMQTSPKDALGKRSRYYHSQIDMELLRSGSFYRDLPDTFVIFICDFDPFRQQKYRYSFSQTCRECTVADLEDGSRTIFLSTKGENPDEISPELLTFLNYVGADLENSAADFGDDYVKSLQDSVKLVKQSREMEQQFMILQELIDAGREEGREEGRAEAVEGLTSAILTLLASKGTVTDELRMRITSENDLKLLRNWLDLAVKSTSVEQYVLQINS
ncbi:MAG: Rpn family recombination-promoting nuclease/putative transposase [Lachnospiraceae bacterium]|nr:Rpn family recombination-promoting nuclease/putative transposase [Lachnospiraceae bacterium]